MSILSIEMAKHAKVCTIRKNRDIYGIKIILNERYICK